MRLKELVILQLDFFALDKGWSFRCENGLLENVVHNVHLSHFMSKPIVIWWNCQIQSFYR